METLIGKIKGIYPMKKINENALTQRIAVKDKDGNVHFMTLFNNLFLIEGYKIGDDIMIGYTIKVNGEYTNKYINSLIRPTDAIADNKERKSSKESLIDFYNSKPDSEKKAIDNARMELQNKHLCSFDKYEFFKKAYEYYQSNGVQKLQCNHMKVMEKIEPIRITSSNLDEVYFLCNSN